jgi:hypothetical protein
MIIIKPGIDLNEPPGTPWYVGLPVTCPRCGVEFSLEETDGFSQAVYPDYGKSPITLYFICPNDTCQSCLGMNRPAGMPSIQSQANSQSEGRQPLVRLRVARPDFCE